MATMRSSSVEQSPKRRLELERTLKRLNLSLDEVDISFHWMGCRVCEGQPADGTPFCKFTGKDEEFICSDKCYHNFWADVRQIINTKSENKKICLLPCCTDSCQKDKKYCKLDHRKEHEQHLQMMYYGYPVHDIPRCQLKGCQRICATQGKHSFYDFCCRTHSKIQSQRTDYCDKCSLTEGPIYFYGSYYPFYELSNFYKFAPFRLAGKLWKSSEHFFQAQKFIGTPYEEVIRKCESPRRAFELARKYEMTGWKRKDWEKIKLKVMYRALLAKFSTHRHLHLLLHSTGDRRLFEHTSEDSYWGDGGVAKTGCNNLGKLLEDVREVIRGKSRKHFKWD